MANYLDTSVVSFCIFGIRSSSLTPISICLDFIDNSIYLNEFVLCMQVHFNNCLLNFVGSSSYAQDIPVVPKFRKLLSRERYCKYMFDEKGQLLYPTNPNMPSSNN